MFSALTVTELTVHIRSVIENDPVLWDISVQGEVSNMTRASSGHWYFTLKDSATQLKCVMWRSSVERQSHVPQNGDAIIVHGRIGVYEASGVYQLYADSVRPAGVGDLYEQLEKLKAKLRAEGLFEPERKRPIPAYPRQIGVVTSAEAAAFQDIQKVLRRRYPLVEIVLSHCLVQGSEAPAQIVKALEYLNRYTEVDVIMVIRGGGSIEDLWAFNDEQVARAIANSRIPVITGVGHETDHTLVDDVADERAPTPSAAAEMVTPNIDDLRMNLRTANDYITGMMNDYLSGLRSNVSSSQRTLGHVSPLSSIRNLRQRVDDWNSRLISQQRQRIVRLRERVAARDSALRAANPQAIMARGYAVVSSSEDGRRLASSKSVKPGTGLTVQFHDGDLKARVEDKETHERYKRTLF